MELDELKKSWNSSSFMRLGYHRYGWLVSV